MLRRGGVSLSDSGPRSVSWLSPREDGRGRRKEADMGVQIRLGAWFSKKTYFNFDDNHLIPYQPNQHAARTCPSSVKRASVSASLLLTVLEKSPNSQRRWDGSRKINSTEKPRLNMQSHPRSSQGFHQTGSPKLPPVGAGGEGKEGGGSPAESITLILGDTT